MSDVVNSLSDAAPNSAAFERFWSDASTSSGAHGASNNGYNGAPAASPHGPPVVDEAEAAKYAIFWAPSTEPVAAALPLVEEPPALPPSAVSPIPPVSPVPTEPVLAPDLQPPEIPPALRVDFGRYFALGQPAVELTEAARLAAAAWGAADVRARRGDRQGRQAGGAAGGQERRQEG
jgi:hypothetical protein